MNAGNTPLPPEVIGPCVIDPARKPHHGILVFCPHCFVRSVLEIPPLWLQHSGIRGVILDLDNTLVKWREEEIEATVLEWLAGLTAAGMELCILSNAISGGRSSRIAERLGASYVKLARKPAKDGFRRAMVAMGTAPAQTAIVGDQLFTDIWGGNRSGIYTILVHPLHRREFLYTRIVSRPPERLLLRWFRRRGRL